MNSLYRRTNARVTGLVILVVSAGLVPVGKPAAMASEPESKQAGATITGRVLDTEGRPVPGAEVRLHQYAAQGARAESTADASGIYRFEDLPEGHYVVAASAPGLARSFRTTPLEGDGELGLDVVLRKPVIPVIELRDEQDRPVEGARLLELRQRGDNGEFFLRRIDWDTFDVSVSPSDAEGGLRLPALPEGAILTITIDHHRQAPVRIRDVRAAEGTIARATMHRGVPLTLRIEPDESGATVDDLRLELHHDPFDHASTIRTDRIAIARDGTARLAVGAGEYNWLRLQHDDFFVTPLFTKRTGQAGLRIAPGRNDELHFRLHRKVNVRGRVIDVTTGRPLPGMDVRGELANDPQAAALVGNDWSHADWASTDANGEYMLSVAAGRVRISFEGRKHDADPWQIELDVAADGSTVAPDFEVRPTPAIAGTVLDPAGRPAARTVVRFAGRFLRWTQPVLTDDSGRFELQPPFMPVHWETEERLPEQPIVAFHPYEPLSGVMTVRLDNAAGASNVTLRLEKRDYDAVLSDFASEMPGWQSGDTSVVPNAAELLARSLKGRPAPELDGAAWINTERPQMSLADFRGRYVLLDFWFIGCGPCHADFPSVKLAHELYKDHGVTVIGVHNNSATPEAVRAHMEKEGLTFPIVVDHPDGRIEAAYRAHSAVTGFPSYVLIGPDGNVVHADRTVPAPSLRLNKLEILRRCAMGGEVVSRDDR